MNNVIRTLLVYGLCLPGAVFIGYLLSTPMTLTSLVAVGALFFLLIAPFLLRWHHPMLIVAWNMSVVLFFLPGSPHLWLVLAVISFFISLLQRALFKEMRFLWVPSIGWPLLMLAVVALATAQLTGGMGVRALGSEMYGGRRYVFLLAGIIGYFALTAHPISARRAPLLVGLYFLGSLTAVIGNLVPWIPQAFYFLYYVFPAETSDLEIVGHQVVVADTLMHRMRGLSFACAGVFAAMLAAWGIQGVFDVRRYWRLFFFMAAAFFSLYGGFRSAFVSLALIFAILFHFEGLYRTRFFAAFLLGFSLIAVGTLSFADKLPLSVQRSVSFLPIEVDPVARFDAKASTEWRVDMWKMLVQQIPQYFWLGKGYSINPQDLELAGDLISRGGTYDDSLQLSILAGDYHSGPLSLILPLGIFGTLAFLGFVIGSLRALYQNYQFGGSSLKRINTFLLAYFVARLVHFCVVFGDFDKQLMIFTGIVGLSISLNHGVRKPEAAVRAPAFVSKRVDLAGVTT